jgi:DNA-binding NarL/FixJ family response regulator
VVDTAVRNEADSNTVLRVVVVDDHAVVRTGTRQVLETSGDIAVVGEAGDGKGALTLVDRLEPDIVLVDVGLPDGSGIDVARRVITAHPNVRVVMLSACDDDELVHDAWEAGVAGYLLKTIPRDELICAVRAAGRGTRVLDPVLSARRVGATGPTNLLHGSHLTWREKEAVELVAEGLSNRVIALRMGVSVRTIEGHLNHVFVKLGIESRTELVRLVLTGGLGRERRASTSHNEPTNHRTGPNPSDRASSFSR